MVFDDWLHEIEAYSTRDERLLSGFTNLTNFEKERLFVWLEAAYNQGRYDAIREYETARGY